MTEDERRFMRAAIKEARKGLDKGEHPWPDPLVGVVVVKNGKILARAYRGASGGEHGEFQALEKKLRADRIADSTVYVTLEPCSDRGKGKIPCAKRLTQRNVKRVIIGMLDPNPDIRGKGVRILRKAKIAVEFFPDDLVREVEELNRDFIDYYEEQKRDQVPDLSFVERARDRPLDEWYRILQKIYGDKNSHRTPTSIFTHLVEVVGGLSVIVSEKREPRLSPTTFVPKALAWWMALCRKAYVKSVADMVWAKFPYVCPYCQHCPHDAEVCSERISIKPVPAWETLSRFASSNRNKRPERLGEWQKMFAAIYPVHDAERYGWTFARLTEELGELAEAVRVFDKAHGYFCNEAADVFAWLMHVQNLIDRSQGTATAKRGDRLESDFCSSYPDRCLGCSPGKVCTCPDVVEATMVRIAQEMPQGPDLFDFGRTRS